jgi:[acyl-carrier-protein] S-malonyltransferase
MAALIGLDYETASAIAREAAAGEICQPANDNAPGQVVVSGHRGAVERAIAIAKTKGARRALLLSVSAPFHCTLMQPAAEVMAEALAGVEMQAPEVPLVANVTARALKDPAAIRASLVRQVTGTVRWRECVGFMAGEGVQTLCRTGQRQGSIGACQAHRPRGHCPGRRDAGGD